MSLYNHFGHPHRSLFSRYFFSRSLLAVVCMCVCALLHNSGKSEKNGHLFVKKLHFLIFFRNFASQNYVRLCVHDVWDVQELLEIDYDIGHFLTEKKWQYTI